MQWLPVRRRRRGCYCWWVTGWVTSWVTCTNCRTAVIAVIAVGQKTTFLHPKLEEDLSTLGFRPLAGQLLQLHTVL
jgi:hypothetical protein